MAELVYILCAVTSAVCAALLLTAHRRTAAKLLLWAGLCFVGLTVNNVVLVIDRVMMPTGPDLSLIRNATALVSISVLLFGLIWESQG